MANCRKCNVELTAETWRKDSSLKRGYRSTCAACCSAALKEWYRQNAEAQRARVRASYDPEKARARYQANKAEYNAKASAWQKANPEKYKAISKAYLLRHREKVLSKRKAAYLANLDSRREDARLRAKARQETSPDVVRGARKRFYRKHAERINADTKAKYMANPGPTKARSANWARNNHDRALANGRAWKKAHPESGVLLSQRRRARMAGVQATLTKDEWAEILESFGRTCAYCRRTGIPLAQDHVVAISRGGPHTADNVVPACKSCNSKKGNKPIWVMAGM